MVATTFISCRPKPTPASAPSSVMMKPSASAFSPASTARKVRSSMLMAPSTISGSLSMKAMQLFLPYTSW